MPEALDELTLEYVGRRLKMSKEEAKEMMVELKAEIRIKLLYGSGK